MTVRTQFFVSACALAAAVGLGTHRGEGETLRPQSVIHSAFAYQPASADRAASPPRGISKPDTAKVASAMHQLDLSKLTMADFGDVEPAR